MLTYFDLNFNVIDLTQRIAAYSSGSLLLNTALQIERGIEVEGAIRSHIRVVIRGVSCSAARHVAVTCVAMRADFSAVIGLVTHVPSITARNYP